MSICPDLLFLCCKLVNIIPKVKTFSDANDQKMFICFLELEASAALCIHNIHIYLFQEDAGHDQYSVWWA